MIKRPKIIVIVGPTAVGKTSLSIELAKKINGEIISADSRQVYCGLNLGTGKVTPNEMRGIPHHLIDIADPTTRYTVSDFVRDGRTAIHEIVERNRLPIVVGGTFFYVDALLGRVSIPETLPDPELRNELMTSSNEALASELAQKDPERAATIDTKNKRRLIRALEIVRAFGKVPRLVRTLPYDVLIIGLILEKTALHESIHNRLYARLDAGMIAEVENLHREGLSYERMEDLGLEYRYISRYLRGILPKETMLAELETKIRQFAKRQMTWLKRDKEIHWYTKENAENLITDVKNFIEQGV